MNETVRKNEERQLSTMPADGKHGPGGDWDSARSSHHVKDISKRTANKADSYPAPKFRWIPWLLALLVILCLLLAAWVWFQILYITA